MAASTSSAEETSRRFTSAARSVASSRSYSGREGMLHRSPSRDAGGVLAEDARQPVAQRDPLARVQGEDPVGQAAALHLGHQAPAGNAVIPSAAEVRLEVDGHHRAGADVAEDVQRLLGARMAPAVAGAAGSRRSDGDERQVDAGKARADLAEHARVVPGIPGEIDAPA